MRPEFRVEWVPIAVRDIATLSDKDSVFDDDLTANPERNLVAQENAVRDAKFGRVQNMPTRDSQRSRDAHVTTDKILTRPPMDGTSSR